MAEPQWKKIVDDLLRLAQDPAATPNESATARRKLALILERHPEAQAIREYDPVVEFTTADLLRMKQRGISTDGQWTGGTLEEALQKMVADYASRSRGRTLQQPRPRAMLE